MNPASTVAMRQAPLREAYTADPEQALSVKRVRTVQAATTDALHGTVDVPEYPGQSWAYGIDGKVGGLHDLPNPGHLLCAALAGCLDSTVRMLADHAGVGIEDLEVEVVGDVDVRGCLAMERSVRPGFRALSATIHLTPSPSADPRVVKGILDYAERLCVTLDTLRNGVPIEVSSELASVSEVVG
ncbi:MAG: OsmC family protein [Myxococcales bacterium]|nr:OsmC family protein [Myxococcales bacterium]